jgi:hypothetical protein
MQIETASSYFNCTAFTGLLDPVPTHHHQGAFSPNMVFVLLSLDHGFNCDGQAPINAASGSTLIMSE